MASLKKKTNNKSHKKTPKKIQGIGDTENRGLKDLVSIGPAALEDFKKLGIETVMQLRNKDARKLYEKLCEVTGARHDPCVEDVFRCAIEQAQNPNLEKEKSNWFYWSKIRKQKNL